MDVQKRKRLTRLLLGLAAVLIVGGFAGGVLLFRGGHSASPGPQGTRWCPVTELGALTSINALAALSPDDAWLVGETAQAPSSFAHWDGRHWRKVAGGGNASVSLYALQALAANDVWAAGTRMVDNAGGSGPSQVAHLEHWDGSRWQVVEISALNAGSSSSHWSLLSGLSATASNDVWAMGASSNASASPSGSPVSAHLLAHWDGSTWSLVLLPETLPQFFMLGIAALAPNDLWLLAGKGSASGNVLVHWDGTNWRWEELSTAVGAGIYLSMLKGLAPDDLWGAGTFYDTAHNVYLPILVHWDGARWTRVPVPAPPEEEESGLQALQVVSQKEIWAAGTTGANGIFVEHGDGKHWQMLSVPAVPEAHAIDVTTFDAVRGKVWVVEQAFIHEHSSDPHIETTCQVS